MWRLEMINGGGGVGGVGVGGGEFSNWNLQIGNCKLEIADWKLPIGNWKELRQMKEGC